MRHPFHWIKTREQVAEAFDLRGLRALALDLEADSFHHYREKVCLVQISVGGRNYLMDPLDGADPGALAGVLSDPTIRKVLHGADYDLRILHRDHGLEVRGLFDTMVAARLTGARAFGLADLLREHVGVELDKSHQRADWSRRPIPDGMLRYAVLDTAYLEELSEKLERRLDALGRQDWAEEEFRILERVRWDRGGPDPEAFRKVKGARGLDARGLTVLRALHRFREERARRRDVPPFRVLSDATLLELARRRPADRSSLARIRGVSKSLRNGSGAADLLYALRVGEREETVPLRSPDAGQLRRRLPPEVRRRLGVLRSGRDRIAKRLDLEASVVASRRLLEGIAESQAAGREWDDVPGLRRWQAALLREALETAG
jgi:ribonuclease D